MCGQGAQSEARAAVVFAAQSSAHGKNLNRAPDPSPVPPACSTQNVPADIVVVANLGSSAAHAVLLLASSVA